MLPINVIVAKRSSLRIQVDHLLWLTLIISNPFVISYAIGINYRIFAAPLCIALAIVVYRRSEAFMAYRFKYLLVTACQLLFLVFHATYMVMMQGSISPLYINVMVLYAFILFAQFVIARSLAAVKAFLVTFYYVILGISTVSLIGVISKLMGVLGPISSFSRYGLGGPVLNYGLFFSFVQIGPFPRSSGFFDEPGTFGFYITLGILVGTLLRVPNRCQLLLYVGGLTTLSLSYAIAGTLALVPIVINGTRLKLKVTTCLPVLSCIALSIVLIVIPILSIISSLSSVEAGAIKEFTTERIYTIAEGNDGSFNDRMNKLHESVNAFYKLPVSGVGLFAHSDTYSQYHGRMCCNPIAPFAQAGIVGYAVMNALIILLIIRVARISPIMICSSLSLIMYQFAIPAFFDGPLLSLIVIASNILLDTDGVSRRVFAMRHTP